MKYFALVNQGLEEVAQQEIKELGADSTVHANVLEFSNDSENSPRLQSARRILLAMGKDKKFENLDSKGFPWAKFCSKKTFKIEVEGVKGQENRIEIAKVMAQNIFEGLDNKLEIRLEMKKPDFLVVVFFNGTEYFMGLDIHGDLNSRKYRLFPNSASFKGDASYYFVRLSGFTPGEKLLVGFCKDGSIAIEAALFSEKNNGNILAFDESMPNVVAARKNAKVAKVDLEVQKYSLEDLDVKYGEGVFDRCIFYITSKDEDKINELYYQVNYILKKRGTLLLIGRESWEVSVSDKFKLVGNEELKRGESVHKVWVLEKK
jgi:tRNA G10  N-methylase Trm11